MEKLRIDAVLRPFAAAQEAVSRLDERARRSPCRDAWMQRALFHEACACQGFEGDLVHLEDLVLLDGHAYSGAPSMALSSALEILKIWRGAEMVDAAGALQAPRPGLMGAKPLPGSAGEAADADAPTCEAVQLEAWRRIEAETRARPPLIAAAILWDAWLSLLPESRSAWRATLLAALTLKARGLTPNLLLPIDLGGRVSKYRRHPGQSVTARIAGFLAWAEAAALEGQKEFDSLKIADDRLRSSVRRCRSNSRMPKLAELLLERPFVSVAQAGDGAALRPLKGRGRNVVGFTTFPGEIFAAPRSWVETIYPGLAYFNEVDRGGHFAAWEEPRLFSEEVRAAFRSMRK